MTITSFDDLSTFDFSPRRGVTGMDIAPPRPAAVANPDFGIFGYVDAQAGIARAINNVLDIKNDQRTAQANLTDIENKRNSLVRQVQQGQRLTDGQATALDIERQAALANLTLITEALARAENGLKAARQHFRATLRSAADDFLHLIREQAEEASAEVRRATAKANALETWARDVATALQQQLEADDLVRLLGI